MTCFQPVSDKMKNHKQLFSRFEISHDVPLDGGVLRVHEPQEWKMSTGTEIPTND